MLLSWFFFVVYLEFSPRLAKWIESWADKHNHTFSEFISPTIYFSIALTGIFALTVSLTMMKKFQPKSIVEIGKEKCPKCKGSFNTGDSLSIIYAPVALAVTLLVMIPLKSEKIVAGLTGLKSLFRRAIIVFFYVGGLVVLLLVKKTFKKDMDMVEHFRLLACSMILIFLFYFLPILILRSLKLDCQEDYISTKIRSKLEVKNHQTRQTA